MSHYYKLDENKNAIPCTLREWSTNFNEIDKPVGSDIIDGKWISTVWLGLNNNCKTIPPSIFETMIFDGEKEEWLFYQERYSTWKEAEEGHKKAIQWVKENSKENKS